MMRLDLRQSVLFLRRELHGRVLLFTIVFGTAFFLIMGLAPNLSLLLGSLGEALFFPILVGLVVGIWTSAEWYVSLALIVVSLLSGVNIALLFARSSRLREAGATGFGSLLGLTLTGCPSCATGLLPLFGVTIGAGLPFGGVELSLIGIAVLLVALYWNTTAEQCRL